MTHVEGFEFRPANDNEMAQLERLGNYVFASPQNDDSPPPPARPCLDTMCVSRSEVSRDFRRLSIHCATER